MVIRRLRYYITSGNKSSPTVRNLNARTIIVMTVINSMCTQLLDDPKYLAVRTSSLSGQGVYDAVLLSNKRLRDLESAIINGPILTAGDVL
jgi:hypothetical protein